jgi:CspA family cold shock protein
MSLFGKLVISLLIAAIASAVTLFAIPSDVSSSWPVIFIIFAVATIASSLLSSVRAPAVAAGTPATTTAPAKKANDKAKPRAKAKDTPAKAPAKPKSGGKREEGEVKWFNVSKGFGFITRDNGEEIFIHFRSILGEGRRSLKDGQRVSFVVADSDKGLQAEEVEGL